METVEVINLVITILNHSLTLIFTNKLTIFLTLIIFFILRRIFENIRCRRRFPVIVLKTPAGKKGGRGTEAVYCAVCLHHVAGGERYRKLPQCHHCFHVECIDPWFELKSTCPLCRSQLPVNLLPRQTQQEPPSFVVVVIHFCLHAIHDKIKCKLFKIKFKLNRM
ncbi:hypothetical protein L6452_30179 [Arctium lappa]|uniref:Uncharacterized protein n=1 Tax=Arctium lappa TaxID=4217 RepID=A0ACB8ZI00_ARCLA|nr:hypothetical protein L6452_30179 [Arctium lappa]